MTKVLCRNISLLKIQVRDRAQDIPAIQLSNLPKGLYQAKTRLWPWDRQMQDTFPRFPGTKLALLSQISISFPKNRKGFYFLYLPWIKGKLYIVERIRKWLLIYSLSNPNCIFFLQVLSQYGQSSYFYHYIVTLEYQIIFTFLIYWDHSFQYVVS